MEKPKKIIQCCMVGSKYSMEWILSFFDLLKWCGERQYQLNFSFTKGSNIYKCRDRALMGGSEKKLFRGQDYDYILWIDSDQMFVGNCLGLLLEADKDVISAAIMTENGSLSVGVNDPASPEGIRRLEPKELGKEPQEVDCLGFGFTLMKKGIYEKVGYPWHRPIVKDDEYYSEDRSLFKRVKDLGFKLWLHPGCKVWHIKDMPL